MKIFIALSTLIAVSCALPTVTYKPDPDIMYDLMKFSSCIDGDKISVLVHDAIQNDPDIHNVIAYLNTSDFRNHIRALDKEPTYLAILSYLEKYGVPAYENVNLILSVYRIEPINQLTEIRESQTVGTFDSLFDKMMTYIDDKCTEKVSIKNQKDDPKFKDLVDHLESDEFKQIIEAAKASETVKQTVEALNAKGLNLLKYIEYVKKVFHVNF